MAQWCAVGRGFHPRGAERPSRCAFRRWTARGGNAGPRSLSPGYPRALYKAAEVDSVPIKIKFNFDFLKDRYDYELKRKDQITAALTLPVGILIALGAAMAAMARSFSYTDGYLTWCFLLSLGSAAVAFFLCVVNLGRAITIWELPLLSELQTAPRARYICPTTKRNHGTAIHRSRNKRWTIQHATG